MEVFFNQQMVVLLQNQRTDDSLTFRMMVEGYWPDQKTYDFIHEHELYKNEHITENEFWKGLKRTWYYRFERVK